MKNKILIFIALAIAFVLIHKPTYKFVKKHITRPIYFAVIQNSNKIYNHFKDPIIDKNLPKNFYFINLDRSTERLKLMNQQAEKFGLRLRRFPATDGLNIVFKETSSDNKFSGIDIRTNEANFKKNQSYGVFCSAESELSNSADFIYIHDGGSKPIVSHKKSLKVGELGILCSSKRLWEKIAKSNNQIAVIMEDDLIFNNNFKEEIDGVFASLPDKWDFVYLNYEETDQDPNWIKNRPLVSNSLREYDDLKHNKWGAYAYMINSNSAWKLLEIQSKFGNIPADNILMEGVKSGKLKTYIINIEVLQHNYDIKSTIDEIGNRE